MSNLATWLHELADGVIEQAETIEKRGWDDPVASNLRDYFSQLSRVADLVGDDDRVDWAALANENADDLGLDLAIGYQVYTNGENQGAVHLDEAEAIGHAEGLKRIPRDQPVEVTIIPTFMNKER